MAHGVETWGVERAAELAVLVHAALPAEELSEDELVACCWEDPSAAAPPPDPAAGPAVGPVEATGGHGVGRGGNAGSGEAGVVLGLADGSGAVAVVWRPPAPGVARPGAYVKLLAVHPGARRAGRGHTLLAAAESWAWDHGAPELRLAGSPPFYLWPGVDATALAARCLAESRGYAEVGSGVNLRVPVAFRSATPPGVALQRVVEDDDAAAVERLVAAVWPEWMAELRRGIEHGCCLAAFATGADHPPANDRPGGRPGGAARGTGPAEAPGPTDAPPPGSAVGFACHSVSRAGWLGPMGTDARWRGAGVGRALLGAVCRDLMVAEFADVEICWAGPLRFYAGAGAVVGRSFVQLRRVHP
jgi:mycothiol synthase